MNLELQILFVIKKKFPLIILGDLVQICSYSIRYFHVPRAKCSWRKCLYLWNHCASFANFSKYNAEQYGHWRYFEFNIFSRWSNQSISSSRSKCCFFFDHMISLFGCDLNFWQILDSLTDWMDSQWSSYIGEFQLVHRERRCIQSRRICLHGKKRKRNIYY